MKFFTTPGGRLFRLALVFIGVSFVSILILLYFTHKMLADIKDLIILGKDPGVLNSIYVKFIDIIRIDSILGSVSGVIIAIAARYGARETAKSIFENNPITLSKGESVVKNEDSKLIEK